MTDDQTVMRYGIGGCLSSWFFCGPVTVQFVSSQAGRRAAACETALPPWPAVRLVSAGQRNPALWLGFCVIGGARCSSLTAAYPDTGWRWGVSHRGGAAAPSLPPAPRLLPGLGATDWPQTDRARALLWHQPAPATGHDVSFCSAAL
ncbi:hypothetical protein AOLI_G00112370 [Acnodon oligacanthus]